jgi:hypothetical protein
LNFPDANPDQPKPCRRKWKRWIFLGLLVALIGGMMWLNGPGIRWLVPDLARKYLSDAGLRGSFELEGSLTGGLKVNDLKLEGNGVVAKIDIGTVTPDYRLNELRRGKLRGIVVDGLHMELRLGSETEQARQKKDIHLEKLVQTLRSARGKFVPMNVEVKDVTLAASYNGAPLFSLDRSRIRHEAGEDEFKLDLGILTDAAKRTWPARNSSLVWSEEKLTIDRLDLLPGIGFRDLVLGLPESGGPTLETELYLDDAVFGVVATNGFKSLQINLREGKIASGELARRFNLNLPASGELNSLSAEIENLLPNPRQLTGSARLSLENVVYQDWKVPELSLDASLNDESGTLTALGKALNSEFGVNAEVGIVRHAKHFQWGDMHGTFNVAEISKVFPALSGRYSAIDAEAAVPQSAVDGDFHVSFDDNKAKAAEVNLTVKPTDQEAVSPLDLSIGWKSDQTASMRLAINGVKGTVEFDIKDASYVTRVEFDEFKSRGITPWLKIAKLEDTGAISINGVWLGSGDLDANMHQGSVDLASAEVIREGMPPIHAEGRVSYNWPKTFSTENLLVRTDEQTLSANLKLADAMLEVNDLHWKDSETEMATGNAKLPAPLDFSKWRDTLAHDPRPLEIAIDSKVLSLSKLTNWIPAAGKLDPQSTGMISLKANGTYEKPSIDAVVEIRGLRSKDKPNLPPADLEMTVAAREGHVSLEGNLVVPDYPPAVMSASMPFRPADWADNPGLLMEEKLTARMDLQRMDLSRFATMVPGVKKISGYVAGNLVADGVIRKPELKGRLDLTNVAVEMVRSDIPPVTGMSAALDFSPEKITLIDLKGNLAGGSLKAGGSLAMENGKPGALDFRVNGDHIPIKRNESLIVRANADLRLSGTWEQAALTGRAGVVDSMFFRDIELLPIGKPFTVPAAAKLPKIDLPTKSAESVPEPFRDWTLDVSVRTEKPFLVRGNFATGEAIGSIRVRGTIGKPAPDGVVNVSDFKASLPFSTLTVRSGKFIFTPESGFDPILEIRGTADPRPYSVNIYVYGQASDPQLVLTSSPPLPDNEIMTLLATGTTSSGLEDPQAASSRALQLFIEELRRGRFGFGKRLRPLLAALDRVDFNLAEKDPYSNETFSTATVTLTDHWFLTAGMGEEGDSRILAMWRLRFY